MSFNISKFEINFKEKFSYFQNQFHEMHVHSSFNTLLIDSGFQTDMFNLICSTGKESSGDVSHSLDYFREKQLPFCWWAGFENEPEWLQASLESEGLRSSEEETVMAVRSDQAVWPQEREGFVIKQVDSAEMLEDFLAVLNTIIPKEEMKAIEGFYRTVEPSFTGKKGSMMFFVGYLEGRPLATSSVFCSQDIASIFDVIVDPSARGQGLGKLMSAAAMRKGAEKGAENFALTATDDAKFLYEKLGFQQLKLLRVYTPMKL